VIKTQPFLQLTYWHPDENYCACGVKAGGGGGLWGPHIFS